MSEEKKTEEILSDSITLGDMMDAGLNPIDFIPIPDEVLNSKNTPRSFLEKFLSWNFLIKNTNAWIKKEALKTYKITRDSPFDDAMVLIVESLNKTFLAMSSVRK